MNKRGLRTLLVSLLSLVLLVAMSSVSFADDYAGTTYTVRILSGEQGTYNGTEVYDNCKLGDKIPVQINDSTVTLKGESKDKYFVKGLKDAGKDNKNTTSKETAPNLTQNGDTFTITVQKDMDYVVTYGVKASAVKYTVNYMDKDGNKLAESKELYGNIGDKPVVSHVYVEGYVPAAYNLTKTLKADPNENVFTFYYAKGQAVVEPGNNNNNNNNNGNNGNNNANGNNANAANGANGANGNANVNAPANQTPRDLVNLDDEETPLANMDLDSQDENSGMPLAAKIAIAVAAVLAAAIAAVLLLMKRRRAEEE